MQRATTSGRGKNSQSEITLREELEQRDRLDIYRNFLLYCMSGNVVSLPMGTSGEASLCHPKLFSLKHGARLNDRLQGHCQIWGLGFGVRGSGVRTGLALGFRV